MAKNNTNMFFFSKTLIKANKNTELQINSIIDTKKITKNLKQPIKKIEYIKL